MLLTLHDELRDWLTRRYGLSEPAIAEDGLARALARILVQVPGLGPGQLADALEPRADLCSAVLDAVLVGETWFFRDVGPFEFLRAQALHLAAAANRADRPLRMLSLACSSGEEPYSMAMAATMGGLALQQFELDAVDVRARGLAVARAGIYGPRSFRGDFHNYRADYFTPQGDGRHELHAHVRRSVKLYEANILRPSWPHVPGTYDVVFCRNVLIYLNAAARDRLLASLDRLLAPRGVLVLGHAETPGPLADSFARVGDSRAFAYQRRSTRPAAGPPAPAPRAGTRFGPAGSIDPGGPLSADSSGTAQLLESRGPPRAGLAGPAASPSRPGTAPPAAGERARDDATEQAAAHARAISLEAARGLANRGELDAALALVERVLHEQRPSAEGYALLGTVLAAKGLYEAARQAHGRALYLDPAHPQSLLAMSIDADRRGQAHAAAQFRLRLQRVQAAHNPPA